MAILTPTLVRLGIAYASRWSLAEVAFFWDIPIPRNKPHRMGPIPNKAPIHGMEIPGIKIPRFSKIPNFRG